jgi:hypothetical protein
MAPARYFGPIDLSSFGSRLPGIFEECLHVSAAKTLDSPDRMTGKLTPSDHSVYRHRRQLQQVGELADGVEFRLVLIIRA